MEQNGFQSIPSDDDPLRISSNDSKNVDEYDESFMELMNQMKLLI